jgi:RecJ-like exonuclease
VISLFLKEIERVAKISKELVRKKHVRIYAQYDADGITSASIIAKFLIREGCNFELKILKQLNSKSVKEIVYREDDFLIFLDMGSGQIDLLKDIIEKANVLIIDHHEPIKYEHPNLFHINPLLFGEDPEKYSTSLISLMFVRFINPKNIDQIDIAIVGAIGDRREEGIKAGALNEVLEIAKELGFISVNKDLKLFGSNRPLFKTIAYSFDPLIPSVYGNEAAAIQFLQDLGISVKKGETWRTFSDLTDEEKARIADGIIRERGGLIDFYELFCEVFTLSKRPEFLNDSREFSVVINACSRMGESDLAIRLCLGDYSVYPKAIEKVEEYRKKIAESISLIENGRIIEKDNGIFIIGGREIPDYLIGVITSIILSSKKPNKPVFGLAYDNMTNMIKISARKLNGDNINLRDILVNVAKDLGGEAGGHKDAAGAYIPVGKENEFIEKVNKLIGVNNAKE